MPRRWISRIRRRATDQRGAVLVMVLAFMLVVIAVGLAFMQAGSSEARNAHERWASTNAFWLAEAGYQRYAAEEWTNALWS
jgi:Tfp pilus assembly protein PilX